MVPVQSEKGVTDKKIDWSEDIIKMNVSTWIRKIFERVWTFFLKRPIATITCVGILLTGIGTFINAIRPDGSHLSLNGEDIVKFIQAVKSEDSSQLEKIMQRVKKNPKASDWDRAVVEASRLKQAGKIEDAIEKWRSIAIVAEGVKNDLAAIAWFAVGLVA